jgi:glycopeptide antibiotics resistance protein
MLRPSRRIVCARLAFGAWVVLIAAATVPWTSFVGHTHWQKVQWVPFISPPVRPLDILGNILLYVPFGYGIMRASPLRIRARHAVAIASVLSLAVEWSQLYSHSRFPSVQDIACNALGAWLGASWAAPRSS